MARATHWLLTLTSCRIYRLDGSVVIGRAPGCGIQLHDRHVSRRHCELQSYGGQYRLVDLGARNGVFINGRRVAHSWLHDDDIIAVGLQRLVFKAVN
jgi:pSer/pThr/pTyr-binding forkhead associated (FHA) protein